jgi:hypothetical protein
LCFQPFSDLGFSQHVFSFLADGLVQFVHATKLTRLLRVVIDLFQVVLISHRLTESSSFRPEMSRSSVFSTRFRQVFVF